MSLSKFLAFLILAIHSQNSLFANLFNTNALENLSVEEKIGIEWKQQLIHWPLPDKTENWGLIDEAGLEIPTQINRVPPYIETPLNSIGLYTLVNLKPKQTKTLRWKRKKYSKNNSNLKIIKKRTGVILSNGIFNIRLPKAVKNFKGQNAPGPIQGIQFKKGKWFGKSTIFSENIRRISVQILAEGPIYIEAEVTYLWDPTDIFYKQKHFQTKPKYFKTRIRLVNHQPLIYIDGKYNTDEQAHLKISYTNYPKLNRYHGRGIYDGHHTVRLAEFPIEADTNNNITYIPPWSMPGKRNISHWFAAWNTKNSKTPALAMFPTFPQVWKVKNLYHYKEEKSYPPNDVKIGLEKNQTLSMTVKLRHQGTHSYAIYMDEQQSFHEKDPNGMAYIKRHYFDTPLQRVKDWVLDWPVESKHPHLFFNKDRYSQISNRLQKSKSYRNLVKQEKLDDFLENLTLNYIEYEEEDKETVEQLLINSKLPFKEAGVNMHNKGLLWELRARIYEMFHRYGLNPFGISHMMWMPDNLLYRVITADVLLGSVHVPEETKFEIRNLLATLAYQMERPELVPRRKDGYIRGMSNFPTPYYATLGLLGALLSDHPHSKRWREISEDEIFHDFKRQALPDGAWIESYYYQERTMRGFVPAAIALARKGTGKLLTHPLMLATFKGQIQQLTPVDPRLGHRCYPPIGDGTYSIPKLNLFWAAKELHSTHPQLAEEMTWSWEQQGKPTSWLFNKLDPYSLILGDENLPSRAPIYHSHRFEKAAVILRNRYNSNFESYFHLRAASFAIQHFQNDQLSFHWYAKGIPLMLDWGTYGLGRHRSAIMKNQLIIPGKHEKLADIVQASFSKGADYVHVQEKDEFRIRRLLYIKGEDQFSPEYILLRDYLHKPGKVNFWTMASGIRFASKTGQCKEYPKTEKQFNHIIQKISKKPRPELKRNIDKLSLPTLPGNPTFQAAEAGLLPFEVSLKKPWVQYRCTYGAELKIQWFSDIDKIEMGADQYWWYRLKPGRCVDIYERKFKYMKKVKGEHQKLLSLQKNKAGDYLTLLYPTIEEEKDANIKKWGEGIKISKDDGTTHYTWISNPIVTPGKKYNLATSFKNKKDKISATAEAFVIKETQTNKEAHLYQGLKLKCEWLSVQLKAIATIHIHYDQEKIEINIENPKIAQDLKFNSNLMSRKPSIHHESKEISYAYDSKFYTLKIPKGNSHFTIVSKKI